MFIVGLFMLACYLIICCLYVSACGKDARLLDWRAKHGLEGMPGDDERELNKRRR